MKFFSRRMWLVFAVVFASLLVVFSVGTQIAFENSAMLNRFFNTSFWSKGTSDDKYFSSDYSSSEQIAAYGKEICEEVEAEGLVLLKNDNNALPLNKGDRVSCFFNSSVNLSYNTTGSSESDSSTYKNFKSALEEKALEVNGTLWSLYSGSDFANQYAPEKKYDSSSNMIVYKTNAAPWSALSSALSSISTYGDAAIAVVGRATGEGMDISAKNSDGVDGSYLSLSENEKDVLRNLTTMKSEKKIKKIIVLLNTAAAVRTEFLDEAGIGVDACLWIGNLGVTGVNAVANALVSGDSLVVPSGRLIDTYVKDNFSSPAMASWILSSNGSFSQSYQNYSANSLNSTQRYYGAYVEGIYIGYRYYETRYEDVVTGRANAGAYNYNDVVSYPFGYGISYTTFEYSNFDVSTKANGDYEVTVSVKNTGAVYSGKEVVQVYLQKPYTGTEGVEAASVELAGFAKTEVLAPGETKQVTVPVEKSLFKTYDSHVNKTYILDKGKHYLSAGYNAHDALNNILAAKGYTEANGMDSAGNASLAEMVWDNPALDMATYAVSGETGEEVKNRLDFCDMNKYAGRGTNSVTYISRGDWTGTWPTAKVTFNVAGAEMLQDLKSNKTIAEDSNAAVPNYGAKNELTLAMLRSSEDDPIAYADGNWYKLLDQMTFAEQALLVTNGAFHTDGCLSVVKPETFEQDGPTGVSGSKNGLSFPSQGIWAASFNVKVIAKVGDALAEDAIDNRQTGMYLPGINLHRTQFGGRVHEYFSEDPFITGIACEAEVIALQAKGVIAHVKHFVFNDEEDNRNGISIWLNEQSAREIYLSPWEYAVKPSRGNAHAVMSSFNRAGNIWTGASSELQESILRGEWGFDGYVITDMASSNGAFYMVYSDGFMNGTDLWLGSGSASALDSYKTSAAFTNKIRESVHRILYVVANYSIAMNGYTADTEMNSVMPWWGILLITLVVVFAVLSAASVVMLVMSHLNTKKLQKY